MLRWYRASARDLPWRRARDPYGILVSEVMLQQTQAARVVPYWEAWMRRFPSVDALAAAPLGDVLRAWSGLGYNRRARALWQAAAAVARRGWPRDAAGLQELPGVGPYTAAAVASFAWDEEVAAVDVNVRRVVERVDGRRRPAGALAARAGELLPAGRAAEWNQALMELGATVCTARAPRCGGCPVAACRSRGRAPGPVARRARPRFEDTDRYVRGRVLAGLVDGCELAAAGASGQRLERAIESLERDGLVVRENGRIRLP